MREYTAEMTNDGFEYDYYEDSYDVIHYKNYSRELDTFSENVGMTDFVDFVEDDIEVTKKQISEARIKANKEIQKILSDIDLSFANGLSEEEVNNAIREKTAKVETPNDYVEIMYYYAWYLLGKRYYTFWNYYKELHQEMMLAVLAAAPKYDKTKGMPSTFFEMYMNHAACEYINRHITMSTSYFAGIEKKMNDYCREKHVSPDAIPVKEFHDELGLSNLQFVRL